MRKEMREEEKVRNEHIRRGNRDSAPVKKTGPKMADNNSDTTELATKNPAAFAKLIIDKLNKYLESLNAHQKSCDQLDEKLKKVSFLDTSIILVPLLHLRWYLIRYKVIQTNNQI